jgi:hypothetical protein
MRDKIRDRVIFEKRNRAKITQTVNEHEMNQRSIKTPLTAFSFHHPNPALPTQLKLEFEVKELLKNNEKPLNIPTVSSARGTAPITES